MLPNKPLMFSLSRECSSKKKRKKKERVLPPFSLKLNYVKSKIGIFSSIGSFWCFQVSIEISKFGISLPYSRCIYVRAHVLKWNEMCDDPNVGIILKK